VVAVALRNLSISDENKKIMMSCMMIIFVSLEYKESANCRFEGHYGFTRAGNSPLKLLYVIMSEHYHTRSHPNVVDGWLGGRVVVSFMD
jgi:hypothetical protein